MTQLDVFDQPQETQLSAKQQWDLWFKGEEERLRPIVEAADMTWKRFIAFYRSYMRRNPDLAKCDGNSHALALAECAEWGLYPGVDHAYIVPFWNGRKNCHEAKFMPGYRAMLLLLQRSSEIQDVQAECVCKGDDFFFQLGTDPTIRHIPSDKATDEITHAWCLIRFKDGSQRMKIVSAKQINQIRHKSKSDAWKSHPGPMAAKTAIKACWKLCPVDPHASSLFDRAERTELEIYGEGPELLEGPAQQVKSVEDAVKKTVESQPVPEAKTRRRRGRSAPEAAPATEAGEVQANVSETVPARSSQEAAPSSSPPPRWRGFLAEREEKLSELRQQVSAQIAELGRERAIESLDKIGFPFDTLGSLGIAELTQVRDLLREYLQPSPDGAELWPDGEEEGEEENQ